MLIGRFVANTATIEEGFENGYKIWGNKKKWSLTVSVTGDSDAVYLCAAKLHGAQ